MLGDFVLQMQWMSDRKFWKYEMEFMDSFQYTTAWCTNFWDAMYVRTIHGLVYQLLGCNVRAYDPRLAVHTALRWPGGMDATAPQSLVASLVRPRHIHSSLDHRLSPVGDQSPVAG